MACCLGKSQVMHERNIQNWAAHVFNGPERDQEGKQETNHKNTMHRYRHEKSAALCSVMAPHRRVALNRVLRNVKDGGGRCIALRRWRQQVREREREREVEIKVLILLHLTRIASEPTWDGPAELQQRDLQSQRKTEGSHDEGYFGRRGQTLSFLFTLLVFASDVSMYRGVSETDRYSLGAHTRSTRSRK